MTSELGSDTDLDRTDELPVLSEEAIVAAGGKYPEFARDLEPADGLEPPGGSPPSERDPTANVEAPHRTSEPDPERTAENAVQSPATPPPAAAQEPADVAAVETLGRDIAELTARWSGLESVLEANAIAIATLQSELAESSAELRESQARQQSLIDELGSRRARSSALGDELDRARERSTQLEAELESARDQLRVQQRETDARKPDADTLKPYLERIEALEEYIAGRADRWREMEGLVATQVARIKELEQELEHRVERQQRLEERVHEEEKVSAALREQAADLGAALAAQDRDSETTQAPSPEMVGALTTARAELEQARSELARLEDKLTRELRPDRVETRDDTVVALPQKSAPPTTSPKPPILVCLTSDQPVNYVLDRDETTIGRGPDCDIRIMTHFVSREHAALLREDGGTVLVDRGSTNGVFVNAIRIERKPLEHGDWVTIGETQFRYVTELS